MGHPPLAWLSPVLLPPTGHPVAPGPPHPIRPAPACCDWRGLTRCRQVNSKLALLLALALAAGLVDAVPSSADYLAPPENEFVEESSGSPPKVTALA